LVRRSLLSTHLTIISHQLLMIFLISGSWVFGFPVLRTIPLDASYSALLLRLFVTFLLLERWRVSHHSITSIFARFVIAQGWRRDMATPTTSRGAGEQMPSAVNLQTLLPMPWTPPPKLPLLTLVGSGSQNSRVFLTLTWPVVLWLMRCIIFFSALSRNTFVTLLELEDRRRMKALSCSSNFRNLLLTLQSPNINRWGNYEGCYKSHLMIRSNPRPKAWKKLWPGYIIVHLPLHVMNLR